MIRKLRESNNDYAYIVNELENFGFESDDGINYDYYMDLGLVATFDIDNQIGYFTWNPDGNAVDVGTTYQNIDSFLNDVYNYSEYHTEALITSGLIKKGFTVDNSIYTYDYRGTYAEYDPRTDRGYIEYDSMGSDKDIKDNLNLYDFVNELFM